MGVDTLSGGYVGVDVFFVISGFLITGVLLRDLERGDSGSPVGRIRYRTFYMRRLRRLGPALLATLLGTMVAGYVIVPPELYQMLGESAVAALFSVSNILFWAQSGYFDAEAILKPLLHTWSLAVEEQVYFVWPLALAFLMGRLGRPSTLAVLGGLSLVSLLAAELLLAAAPSAVFFLMPFRLFEFALGAALALTGARLRAGTASNLASLGGLALILGAALTFDKSTRFPGVAALVPCLGAALLIWSASSGAGNRLLALGPVRYVGRISYSLYLVHWPLVSLYAIAHGTPTTWVEVAGLTTGAVALGALLYHGVETPFRRSGPDGGFRLSGRVLGSTAAAGAVLVTAAGTDIASRRGYDWRVDKTLHPLFTAIREGKRDRRRAIRQSTCHFSSKNPDYFTRFESCLPARRDGAIVVLGDSHAADIWAALAHLFPDRQVVQLTGAGCALSRPFRDADRCDRFYSHALDWLERNRHDVRAVIYSQRGASAMVLDQGGVPTALDPAAIDRLATMLAEIGQSVPELLVWGPRPEFHPVIEVVMGRSRTPAEFPVRMAAIDTSPHLALDTALSARLASTGIGYLSSAAVLCPEGGACRYLSADGTGPLIVDYGHWTPPGGREIVRDMIAAHPALRALASPKPDSH